MKNTKTVIATIAEASVKKNLTIHKTAFFFNEAGRILSASDTKSVKTAVEALEGATTPEEAEKATVSLKKAAEAAGLPEPVVTAAIGKFVSSYGDKYSKGLKGFIAKDPEKAFGTLSDLPDPLELVNETIMRLFLVYKGEVLCTNPFNKTSETGETGEREELKALLKFARIWAKRKNLTSHIGWLIKSALVADDHGIERAKIIIDCIEDYIKELGFMAGAKEVYYYLFNNDLTYGPVGIGSETKINRYLNGYYGDKFTEEEALTWALSGATSPEIAKLIGDRLGYILSGFGCPVPIETEYSLNRENKFLNRSHELDGLWEEHQRELDEDKLPTRDFKEVYDVSMIAIAMARSLGLCQAYEWAVKKGRVTEKTTGPNATLMIEFSKRERSLFEEYCGRYNPQTPIEVFEVYKKMVLDHYDEVSPDAHHIAMSITELDALAKFPDGLYLRTVDANGNETVITNEEFITNLLITLEEFLNNPEKLLERKNVTVDPVTREVKEAPPKTLTVGRLLLYDEPYGFKEDPRKEYTFNQDNLSWLKVKNVFESDDAFDGKNYEDLDLYSESYDEDLDF